jgi:hypothetical protein
MRRLIWRSPYPKPRERANPGDDVAQGNAQAD